MNKCRFCKDSATHNFEVHLIHMISEMAMSNSDYGVCSHEFREPHLKIQLQVVTGVAFGCNGNVLSACN